MNKAYVVIIFVLTLVVPVLVLPMVVDNAFNTPKTLLMLMGVSIMVGIYSFQFFSGKTILKSKASTPKILLFLILLNFFSFFYTDNYYFTIIAAMMNVTCLLFFCFVSLHIDGKKGFWVIVAIVFSGLLVSFETYLQFFGRFILFKWAHPGMMVMGTIGNSNYLGAYLVFPLFATAGLIFLLKGKLRLIPLGVFIFMLGAFLFTRARAGWFGFFFSLPIFLLILKNIYKLSIWEHLKANPRQVITYGVALLSVLVSLWYIAPQRLHIMMGFRNVTDSKTLKLRMQKYYQASRWLFMQNPLFGTGLWSFRNMVYEAQAEINNVDKDYFVNYPEPKPRRVHNDYLEILNDGGLLAALALLLYLFVVMRHGWRIIRDEKVDFQDRIITATAFCSVIAVMLAAFFFFPFRINSTMFMTVLMMGLMEGIYLSHYGLVSISETKKSEMRFLFIPMVFLLVGAVWFTGIKPFIGEMEHFKYKKALALGKAEEAERFIKKAIDYDPHNSAYCLYASQLYMNVLKDFGKARDFIERAIIDFNGDITRWSIFFIKGLLKFQTGSLYEAQAAFEKSLYYNPTFEIARQKLEEVKKVIKDHDRVLIKFR